MCPSTFPCRWTALEGKVILFYCLPCPHPHSSKRMRGRPTLKYVSENFAYFYSFGSEASMHNLRHFLGVSLWRAASYIVPFSSQMLDWWQYWEWCSLPLFVSPIDSLQYSCFIKETMGAFASSSVFGLRKHRRFDCCAQQSVHLYEGGSTLYPHLLYWSRNLCCTKSKILVTNNK